MREQVSNELVETINEFGPKMFEDFDEVRYIFLHTYINMNSPPVTVAYPRPVCDCTSVEWAARDLEAQERDRGRRRTGQPTGSPNGQHYFL